MRCCSFNFLVSLLLSVLLLWNDASASRKGFGGNDRRKGDRKCEDKFTRYKPILEIAQIVLKTPMRELQGKIETIGDAPLAMVIMTCWDEIEKDGEKARFFKGHPIVSRPKVIAKVVHELKGNGGAYQRWINGLYGRQFDVRTDVYYTFRMKFMGDGTMRPLRMLMVEVDRMIKEQDFHPKIPVALPSPHPNEKMGKFIMTQSLMGLCNGKNGGQYPRDVMVAYLQLLEKTTEYARKDESVITWFPSYFMKKIYELPVKDLPSGATVIMTFYTEEDNSWELVLLQRLKSEKPLVKHIQLCERSKGFKSTLTRIQAKVAKATGKRTPHQVEVVSELSKYTVRSFAETGGALLYHAKMIFFGYQPDWSISEAFVRNAADQRVIVASELLTGLVFRQDRLSSHYPTDNNSYYIEFVGNGKKTDESEDKTGNSETKNEGANKTDQSETKKTLQIRSEKSQARQSYQNSRFITPQENSN